MDLAHVVLDNQRIGPTVVRPSGYKTAFVPKNNGNTWRPIADPESMVSWHGSTAETKGRNRRFCHNIKLLRKGAHFLQSHPSSIMTAMDSVKSLVNNKKGKPWVYFSKSGKKAKSNKTASTKPSGTDDTPLPHRPSTKAFKKKRKRKGKKGKPQGNSVKTDEDELKSKKEATSTSTVTSKVTTETDDPTGPANADKSTSNASKAKQQKKKRKRKLKILKRKEKEKKSKGNSVVTSSSQVTSITKTTTNKSKKTLDEAKSCKASRSTNVEKMEGEASIDDKSRTTSDVKKGDDEKYLSRKRKRKGDLDTKKKKKQRASDALDSGMSSGTETPHLPEEPEDVASNWKALVSKLKATAPKKPKLKTKNRTSSDIDDDKKENEIWFDDVDPALLEAEKGSSEHHASENAGAYTGNNKITKCVALDCEMVGTGLEGKESILARVSMVNEYGQCIYDKFVKPREKVTDFRTEFSGVRPKDLFKGNAEEFLTVQKEVSDIMKDRLLVGHALTNDMKVLYLGHPRRLIRDTASYPHFRELMKTKRPALKKLAKTVLGVTVQEGEHNSVEDAQTAMRLYTLHRTAWEKSIKQRGKKAAKK